MIAPAGVQFSRLREKVLTFRLPLVPARRCSRPQIYHSGSRQSADCVQLPLDEMERVAVLDQGVEIVAAVLCMILNPTISLTRRCVKFTCACEREIPRARAESKEIIGENHARIAFP